MGVDPVLVCFLNANANRTNTQTERKRKRLRNTVFQVLCNRCPVQLGKSFIQEDDPLTRTCYENKSLRFIYFAILGGFFPPQHLQEKRLVQGNTREIPSKKWQTLFPHFHRTDLSKEIPLIFVSWLAILHMLPVHGNILT